MRCSLCKKEANVFYSVEGRQLCEECYAVWSEGYHVCRICGKLQPAATDIIEELRAGQLCFDCWFWLGIVAKRDDLRSVRIDHWSYFIGDGDGCYKGFGGQKFTIKFYDGRVVETDDLWCQGRIPERFWDDLPDNAQFV